jgi:colanic acid/amylovoran biosynthesis glycosyltransferase
MGRFVEKKGFRYLVDAVAQLRASGVEVELRMIGGGPLVDDVKAQIRRLGLEENVTLLGPLPDAQIPEQFDWTDVFVVPSVTAASGEKEGIPGVITEAMLLGVPVIATRHSGIPEHVIHRETGLLVEERAPDEIAAAVEALRDDPDLRRGCMARGRQLALDEFNIHTTLKQKKAVFETYG